MKRKDLSHLVVKGDLLVGRRLVGGEDTADDVGAGGGASDVRELVVAEGCDGSVEVGGRPEREAPEEESAAGTEERLEAGFLGRNGRSEGSKVEIGVGTGGDDSREDADADGLLFRDAGLDEYIVVSSHQG